MPRLILLLLAVAALMHAGEPLIRWGEWRPLEPDGKPLDISYFNLLPAMGGKEGVELWFDAGMGRVDAVIGLSGPDLGRLPRTMPRFDSSIIQGYDADLLGRATPIISRSQAARLADGRMVVTAGIGPAYGAGGKLTELWPAVFASPDGAAGSWKHLGPPPGEPLEELRAARAAKQVFRYEGGSLLARPDGGLVLYCGWNPGDTKRGAKLAALTAPSPEGPWAFRREQGRIADLAARLPGGWLFPAVHDLGPHGLLLAGGDTWPPKRIDGAISRDGGRTFAMLPAPLLLPDQVLPGATSVKSVRLLYRAASNDVLAVANPHQRGGNLMYPLYWCVGTLPPAPKAK